MNDQNRRGIECFNAGKFEEALGHFRAAITAGERGAEPRCFLAHALDSAGRPDEAVAEFSSILKSFPSHLPAYEGLAKLLLRRGAASDDARALERVTALEPARGKIRRALGATLRLCASVWRATGDLVLEKKALRKAARLASSDEETSRRLQELCRTRERPRRTVKPAAPTKRPDLRESRRRRIALLHRRGLSLASSGRLADAERCMRRALAIEPGDEEARSRLLEILRVCGQTPDDLGLAEKALRKALAIEPRDLEARRLLLDVLRRSARAKLAAGEFEPAERILSKALTLEPRDRETRRDLAEARHMREQVETAEKARLTAARNAKADKIRMLNEKLQTAGRIYDLTARRRKVEGLLRKILKADPRNVRARLIAGGILCVSGALSRGRGLLAGALRLDRGEIGGGEAFSALMKLGRYKAAVARAERVLDGTPDLADMRAFWNPWSWDARMSPAQRCSEIRKMARALRPDSDSPWLHFYRGDFSDSEDLLDFERISGHPSKRYGWMFMKAGRAAFTVGRFDKAVEWFKIALAHKSVDWRAHAYLAEGLLCLRRPKAAYAQMDRALRAAPEREARDVLAWRGALDLWLGRYEEALAHLDRACRMDASFAYCWRGGALVKLGRFSEAVEWLDETLRRFPQDFESYVWRGEAKRELGRYKEAIEDLNVKPYADSPNELSIGLWSLVNRALAKAALGDNEGFRADFEAVPSFVVNYIRRKTGLSDPERILRAGLDLSRGFRRDDYRQAIWMVGGRAGPASLRRDTAP